MKTFYNKYMLKNMPFHIFSLIAAFLLITSFFLPPTGVIDSSVMAACGELFAFAALWTVIKAIDKGSDVTFSKGDMSVTLDNEKENRES